METISPQVTAPAKPRRPWIAALLSLFVPGLGQLYAGRPGRAVAVYLGSLAVLFGLLMVKLPRTFIGLIVFLLAALSFLAWAIWDAVRIARRNQGYVLRPFNRWYVYLLVVLAASFVPPRLLALSPLRSFRIPSGSMEPAVRIGDDLYADMSWYRSARPVRGDLVIYSLPEVPTLMAVKRIIGLEGEQVEIRNKTVFINGQLLDDPWNHHGDSPLSPAAAFSPELKLRDDFGPLKIPPGTVFILGDNRDNSYDSRFFGPIPLSSLRGHLLYVYWSTDRSRIGTLLK